MADLQFPEVTRALRALSSAYVERRGRLREGAALSGTGKRAAFALFYGPLHFLLVEAIVSQLPAAQTVAGTLVDLGCGTGAAGAGWVAAAGRRMTIHGIDRHPWAVNEAHATYRELAVRGHATLGDLARDPLPKGRAYLAAFALNELADAARSQVLTRLLAQVDRGSAVLVVEPLARGVAPWWQADMEPFVARGGRLDEWRFPAVLPALVGRLDRAAGLRHGELTGRSLWVAGPVAGGPPPAPHAKV